MMNNEIWLSIPEYEGLYEVSNLGRIRSLNYNKSKQIKVLKEVINNHGYVRVGLYNKSGYNQFQAHRLVADAFVRNPDKKTQVNHKDCVKTNNSADNLEWFTAKENIKHAVSNGINIGETHTRSKFTNNMVIEIRNLYKNGASQRGLAKKYNVSRGCITGIVKNRNWAHI